MKCNKQCDICTRKKSNVLLDDEIVRIMRECDIHSFESNGYCVNCVVKMHGDDRSIISLVAQSGYFGMFKYFDMFKYLVDEGAELNSTDPCKNPLVYCAGDNNVTRYLLDNGADLNIELEGNSSAPYYKYIILDVCRNGSYEDFKFIVERGGDIFKEDDVNRVNSVFVATQNACSGLKGRISILKDLIDAGVRLDYNYDAYDPDINQCAIDYSCYSNYSNIRVFKLLLNHGALDNHPDVFKLFGECFEHYTKLDFLLVLCNMLSDDTVVQYFERSVEQYMKNMKKSSFVFISHIQVLPFDIIHMLVRKGVSPFYSIDGYNFFDCVTSCLGRTPEGKRHKGKAFDDRKKLSELLLSKIGSEIVPYINDYVDADMRKRYEDCFLSSELGI